MSRAEQVTIHYMRPPRRCDTFVQQLIHESAEVIVTYLDRTLLREPVRVNGQPVLENGSPAVWFTFPGLWYDIGRFHLRDGTFTGLYANILTPVRFETAREWHTTDLFADVWLPASGRERAQLLDEDELSAAAAAGWIDVELAARARAEAAQLLQRVADGTWPPPPVSEWSLERVLRELTGHGTSRAPQG